MGVSSSESHDLTAFYEMLTASFGVLSQNTGFYPSLDRIVETTLRPLNLGPGGRSYNEPISHLQHGQCGIFSNPDISDIDRHLQAGRDSALTACMPYSFTSPIIHFDSCNQFHVHMYISCWGPGEQSPSLEIIFDSYRSCAPISPLQPD